MQRKSAYNQIVYIIIVDLTPEARQKGRHTIPWKYANTPSEEVTEVGSIRPYTDAAIKKPTL